MIHNIIEFYLLSNDVKLSFMLGTITYMVTLHLGYPSKEGKSSLFHTCFTYNTLPCSICKGETFICILCLKIGDEEWIS